MSHIVVALEAYGCSRNSVVVARYLVGWVTIVILVVTCTAGGLSVAQLIVLGEVVGLLAIACRDSIEGVVGIGVLHWSNVVVDEHDVAQFLGIFLHVSLGGIDVSLCRGHKIGCIVAHFKFVNGNEHSIRLEELREVGLCHITNLLGQMQVVILAVRGWTRAARTAPLVDGTLTHSAIEVGVELVVVVHCVEVEVELEEHGSGVPNVATQPRCAFGKLIEAVVWYLAARSLNTLFECVDVREQVV